MVDEFLTDEQQAERARAWLRSNGAFIVAGALLGVGILFGIQQWRAHNLEVSGEASVVWEQLRGAIDGERFNEVEESLALLEDEYPGTPYMDSALLALAKMHMERNEPQKALERLEKLADDGADPHLRRIGELRMAQIYIHLGDYNEALAVLGDEEKTALAGQFHELRGDAFVAQGFLEEAREEYEEALESDVAGVLDRAFVQIKLDDVTGSLVAGAEGAGDEAAGELEALPGDAEPAS